jgi:hypothetical protein
MRQRFAKRPSEIVQTAMADTQSDGDPATPQNNPLQLREVSSLIQM